MLVAKNCVFLNSEAQASIKCAVNPVEKCVDCQYFSSNGQEKELIQGWMPSENLISAVIRGVITSEYTDTTARGGKYRVTEYLSTCNGGRNISDPDVHTIHTYKHGAPYRDDSFYGNFISHREAAVAAIKSRGIIAVDAHNRAVLKKGKNASLY